MATIAKKIPPLKTILSGACDDAVTWAKDYKTPRKAWFACERPDWMLWALDACGLRDETQDRIFACRCIRETPLADGRKVWDLLTDQRSRNAVEVAERFTRGEATREELAAAAAAAAAAAWAAAAAAAWAAAPAAAWDAASKHQAEILRDVYRPFKK